MLCRPHCPSWVWPNQGYKWTLLLLLYRYHWCSSWQIAIREMQQTLCDWTVTRNYRRFMMMSTNIFPLTSNKLVSYRILPGGGGGDPKKFSSGVLPPKGRPLTLYTPFLTEKMPLSYTFHWQMIPPFHIASLGGCTPFNRSKIHCLKNMNKSLSQELFLTFSQP